ncbi:MAG: ABC transporter [SAR86 cluster bacterium BACL1 MAG-120920-bin57]|jgi:ABC-2 type transport system ATP-binding protein|uniref:ABC transporter n=2 Tax=SAR86 cluster TaxID=62672 RepID=A0A0R2UE64_9GAMM|nr:MAG: ABC transporter [SAR86 cluster bacterium BACL1 MAG-120920-bin57]KRO95659.1 MAG: ABC transporter [SAR86 cluster bacterium BACL1 MAG-120820-bin45]KRO98709.1 MAG: ABC transporter [SAR86 cluster bacterium BACL1 MAG-120823-bin87]KRP02023.1 MAG: ABC transporter [SAR86 cluster bacterium BACL1 MAG-120924-bin88]KRP14595.1 MAG: ABC transporter [SAR86 cluster bacterium BACL1 MAG-121001-bin56]KRP19771.1 MAG: ABC transporter [SAR86 cluster bacterium BACL1 MAG-121022-bin58]KRP22580.1 MAG: ABC trans
MNQYALEITGLKKVYASGVVALKGIDLTVNQGDFFALLGPNGAGKSSTIGIIGSLVNKTAGKVKIFGIDTDVDFPEAKRLLGVVSQEINFSQFEKVLDIVVTQAGFYGISASEANVKAETVLKRLGLWDKRDSQARTLSGGYKRRLMIAKALIHDPKLLILDEPTAGVDIELRREMWDFLKEINVNGTTIILTTHYLEEAEQLCKNIAIIDHGELVENTSMKNLLSRLDVQGFVLDVDQPLEAAPIIDSFTLTLEDANTINVAISKGQSINELFVKLSELNIQVNSMRNESNRLEEMFIEMVKKQKS